MEYQFDRGIWQNVFWVPSAVEEHLASASGDEVKVLLAVLSCKRPKASSQEIARIAGVRADVVDAAVAYWVKKGILPARLSGGEEASPPSEDKNETPSTALPPRRTEVTPPVLTAGEIAQMVRENGEIAFLLQSAEALYGRPVSSTEQRGLVSMREWLGLPVDVILMVVKYCIGKGKGSIRYIQKTAAAWYDEGIRTHEAAEKHLKKITERDQSESQVQSMFGISGRSLSVNEKKYIDRWVKEYGFDMAMIREAYERTVDQIGKMSFPYINKILASWHDKGFRTPQEAQGEKTTSRTEKGSFDINDFEDMGIFDIPDGKGK